MNVYLCDWGCMIEILHWWVGTENLENEELKNKCSIISKHSVVKAEIKQFAEEGML